MPLTIAQLKSKWNKEKEFYKKQELGAGVQSFVKDCLESEELFGLKSGKLSTKDESRRNEFIYEKQAKDKGRADFAVYINSEIIIPMEVERYENIKAGIKQLFAYQKGFDKQQYGILTDGFTWRLYTNSTYREYTLDHLFDRKSEFWTYWDDYIKPELYYLNFFEPIGQRTIFEEKLPVDDFRQLFFEDITSLIRKFKDKLKIEGYFKGLEQKERGKKAVEITYAYIIQFILYKTLVDNAFDDFPNKFKDGVKHIHGHLKARRYKDILGIIDSISNEISRNIYRPFTKEQEFINKTLLELYRVENKLADVAPWLDIFVFIRKYSFANIHNEIFGYIYENYLKALYEDESKGQYFTDPAVVNFMLEQMGWTKDKLQKRDKESISLIDPACGSGTFLYSAVDNLVKTFNKNDLESAKQIEEIVNKNIFGLDIAEFPLYLAEMNILMRLLPLIITEKYNNPIDKKIKVFKTNDSIAEFIDAGLKNTISDIDVNAAISQQGLFDKERDLGYQSYVRDEGDLAEMKKSMRPPRRRFDYVISNPPYISYNECSNQNILIVKLIQQKKCQMSDIYGVNLNTVPGRIKPYSPKPNLYAFFIALGLSLLKDNGKLCFIIPQTMLVNTDLDVVRYHLAKFTTIEKIITFSGKMFAGRGIKQNKPVPTSSLIFVVRRKVPDKVHQVEIIHYKDPNDEIDKCLQNILTGEKINRNEILQNKLLQNVANWNFIKHKRIEINFTGEYLNNTEDLDIYRNYTTSRARYNDIFIIDGSINIPKKEVIGNINKEESNYYKVLNFGDGVYMNLVGYYPKDKPIKIAEGSQGLKVIEPKNKIFWRYINHDRFYFYTGVDVIPIYQQYCFASNNRNEILYLLSILNSPIIGMVLKLNLKVENEDKLNFLLGVRVLKEFVRVPKITEHNQHIKDEVVKRTEEMLGLEEKTLSDFVDFSDVMIQKFEGVAVESGNLVLAKNGDRIKCKIKGDAKLVNQVITDKYHKGELKLEKQSIALSELKSLPVIDFEKQKEIKGYIDDLVFALYFNVNIRNVGLDKASQIKTACARNKYYEIVSP
ncbi:MAG: N-6 DNA methylase [Planctomycetota bacterium]